MKALKEKLELWAMAVAYAEIGDRETVIGFFNEMRKTEKEIIDEKREVIRKQAVNRPRNYKM